LAAFEVSGLAIWWSESSRLSQAFPRPEVPPLKGQKSPLLAGFRNSAPVSELTNWQSRKSSANSFLDLVSYSGAFQQKSSRMTVLLRLPISKEDV